MIRSCNRLFRHHIPLAGNGSRLHSTFTTLVCCTPGKGLLKGATVTDSVIGRRFGKLVATEAISVEPGSPRKYLCLCDCGRNKVMRRDHLLTNKPKSCGCMRKELKQRVTVTHGHKLNGKASSEYMTWAAVKQRCLNCNNRSFHNYGGRGILMCQEWKTSFAAFFQDMGKRPPGTTLERRDNNGNYEPSNCKWATKREQCNNTRRNKRLTYLGQTLTMAQWERRKNFNHGLIHARLTKGWSVERSIETPVEVDSRFKKGHAWRQHS